MDVDEIYVVSLKSAVHRREQMEKWLPEGVNWYISVRDPIDGKRGCWESHRAIINNAKERGLSKILIFEDDAYFRIEWPEIVKRTNDAMKKLPSDWSFFMLGYIPYKMRKYTNDIYRVKRAGTTHAYIINLKNIEPIPKWWIKSKHIDWYLFGHGTIYPTYAIFPCLFFQRGANTFIDKSYLAANKRMYDTEGFIDRMTMDSDTYDMHLLGIYLPIIISLFLVFLIFVSSISSIDDKDSKDVCLKFGVIALVLFLLVSIGGGCHIYHDYHYN